MPTAPPRPCRWPGCPALVSEPRERFCEHHRKEHKRQADREYDRRRPSSAERGYDADWQRLRRMMLAEQPLCVMCLDEGRVTPATEVHHRDGNPRNNDPANLMPLCKPCHSRITNREQGGRVWTR